MSLSSQQEHVLAQLSAGLTIENAARSAGIHRNTIHNWLRSDPEFEHALTHARQARTLFWQGQAELLAGDALDTIRKLMVDPQTPPATRLRAAQIILNLAANPPIDSKPKFVHKIAQLEGGAGVSAADGLPEAEPEKVHNSAQALPQPQSLQQQPYRRPTPKIGRNESCPCGSGRKFKYCCLGKTSAAPPPTLSAA